MASSMMRQFGLCAAGVLACASLAQAWGEEGHQIVGTIAMTRLTPQARAAIIELLGNDDLAKAGLWADQIRGDSKYDWAKPYHYINLPRTAEMIDLSRDCPTGECVVAAIPKFLAKAADPSLPIDERREALKFAVHFIGDLHQPLHAGYKDDLGGNRIQIVAFGGTEAETKTNLHALWDSVLIRHRSRGEWRTLAGEIAASAPPDLVASWQSNLDSVDWANESAAITRMVYKDLPTDQRVGETYYEANIATVMRRLAAGGVRMAAILNRTFAQHEPAKPVETAGGSGQGAPAREDPGQVAPAN
ncbi:MAG: endonuclease [Phycisphaerales bacterium]|nr:endonuclease [Phycisphaerales bacterium]